MAASELLWQVNAAGFLDESQHLSAQIAEYSLDRGSTGRRLWLGTGLSPPSSFGADILIRRSTRPVCPELREARTFAAAVWRGYPPRDR